VAERVAFISRFNQTCGVAAWAEPVVDYLLRQGYEVRVFANVDHRFWVTQPDEPYVVRSYVESVGKVDPKGFKPDIVVVQQHCVEPVMVPHEWVNDENVKKVMIVHHPQTVDWWAPRIYDLVVGFDDRWLPYFREKGVENYAIIPYPVRPCARHNRQEMRKRWRLPQNKVVVLIYGIRTPDYLRIWSYPVIAGYYVLWFTPVPVFAFSFVGNLDVRLGVLSPRQLDEILSACDVLWLHKPCQPKTAPILSSTVYQTLDSGIGIALLDGAFSYDVPGDVVVYQDERGIVQAIRDAAGRCDWAVRKKWMENRTPDRVWGAILDRL